MAFKVKFNHIGNLKKRFKALNNKKVSVGWSDKKTHQGSGMTYAALAELHEEGFTVNGREVPARPALTNTFLMWKPLKKNKDLERWIRLFLSNIKQAVNTRMTAKDLVQNVGEDYTRYIYTQVIARTPPLIENAPMTIDLKGFDAPLYESGDFSANLTYVSTFNRKHIRAVDII